ncbi:hypothetical protein V499_01180 [Pseudogymnoascus sp. VKM F-103]|nr:hypothetical protein V499_01180 [Pseudogymnoascus sp. VKM F-103]
MKLRLAPALSANTIELARHSISEELVVYPGFEKQLGQQRKQIKTALTIKPLMKSSRSSKSQGRVPRVSTYHQSHHEQPFRPRQRGRRAGFTRLGQETELRRLSKHGEELWSQQGHCSE